MPYEQISGAYPMDIMGLVQDQILGDDEAGAIGPPLSRASAVVPSSLGHSLPSAARQVRGHRLTQGRRIPIGLGIFATAFPNADGPDVPAGGRLTVTSKPQVLFRFERILIPSDFAGSFILEDVLIGNASIFAERKSIPARVFDETATNTLLGVKTNQIATDIVVQVANFTALASPFTGALIGIAVE